MTMMTISTLMTILTIMTIPTRRRKIKCGEEVGLLPMTMDETSASAKIASKLDQEAAGREDNDDMQRRVLLTLVNGCQQSGARKNTYMRVCRMVCPFGPFCLAILGPKWTILSHPQSCVVGPKVKIRLITRSPLCGLLVERTPNTPFGI